jgi:hypothetical protein
MLQEQDEIVYDMMKSWFKMHHFAPNLVTHAVDRHAERKAQSMALPGLRFVGWLVELYDEELACVLCEK